MSPIIYCSAPDAGDGDTRPADGIDCKLAAVVPLS